MKYNKFGLKIVISLVAIILIALVSYFIYRGVTSKTAGEVQIVLVNLEEEIVSDKKIKFKKDMTLVNLLKENYDNVVFENGMIMKIGVLETTIDSSGKWIDYIALYTNDEYSLFGVEQIELVDGLKVSLRHEKISY